MSAKTESYRRLVDLRLVVWSRLVLHTAAYWLMLDVRDAIPKIRDLAKAEFTTLRLRLLKLAARVVETRHRVRIAFAAACRGADLIAGLSAALLRRRI